jgi:hypothetical protein
LIQVNMLFLGVLDRLRLSNRNEFRFYTFSEASYTCIPTEMVDTTGILRVLMLVIVTKFIVDFIVIAAVSTNCFFAPKHLFLLYSLQKQHQHGRLWAHVHQTNQSHLLRQLDKMWPSIIDNSTSLLFSDMLTKTKCIIVFAFWWFMLHSWFLNPSCTPYCHTNSLTDPYLSHSFRFLQPKYELSLSELQFWCVQH